MSEALVFLHAFPYNQQQWAPQVQYFSKKYADKFKLYTPDLRGHGEAGREVPKGAWMIAHYVEDLRQYLDKNQIPQAHLCGLSMGGYVALHFVEKYPDRVKSLILCDTQASADTNEGKDKRFAAMRRLEVEDLSTFADGWLDGAVGPTTLKEKPEILPKLKAMITGNLASNISMSMGALTSRRDSLPFLSKIKCPTLVMVGSEDQATPPAANEAIAKGIPGAEYRVIERAGHLSNLEQPEKFNELLEQFLMRF